jgi:hypothetical protein
MKNFLISVFAKITSFILSIFILVFVQIYAYSDENDEKAVLEEGKLLCRLEKASWYATDYIQANLKGKSDSLGGYLSYQNDENKIITIFYSRYDLNYILVRMLFDFNPKKEPLLIDIQNHSILKAEIDLISIRQDAMKQVFTDTTKFFKFYENTSFNLIPLINEKGKRVFILTGPQNSGEIIIGNDYLLTYNSKNEFENKVKLHNSLLKFPFKPKELNSIMGVHNHILYDGFTSTDICTLLLYKDFVSWKYHAVMFGKYVSYFDLENETITTRLLDDDKKATDD